MFSNKLWTLGGVLVSTMSLQVTYRRLKKSNPVVTVSWASYKISYHVSLGCVSCWLLHPDICQIDINIFWQFLPIFFFVLTERCSQNSLPPFFWVHHIFQLTSSTATPPNSPFSHPVFPNRISFRNSKQITFSEKYFHKFRVNIWSKNFFCLILITFKSFLSTFTVLKTLSFIFLSIQIVIIFLLRIQYFHCLQRAFSFSPRPGLTSVKQGIPNKSV